MEQMSPRTRGEFLFGLLFFAAVVFGLSRACLDVHRGLFEQDLVPVSGLVVQGELEYVTREDVRAALQDDPALNNFFTLDVNEVQQRIEGLPWVHRVSVRKRWPALLYVYVVEKTPRAHWGEDRLLSDRGDIFTAPLERLKQPLVTLSGPDTMADRVWDQYQQFQRLLGLNGYKVAALHLTERHAWEVQLADGPRLKLGRGDTLARLQRFIDVYPLLEEREKMAYIDLRYDTGVAVGWKASEGTGNDQDHR